MAVLVANRTRGSVWDQVRSAQPQSRIRRSPHHDILGQVEQPARGAGRQRSRPRSRCRALRLQV